MKYSIIVPVYNVEKYIERCISSAISQTFADFELILVDDGSPDNSPKMCDDWAKKDSRIKVIHKENGGVSSARNAGLDNASGEWIIFIDADDVLDKDLLLNCNNYTNKEIEFFNYKCVFVTDDNKQISAKVLPVGDYDISTEQVKLNLLLDIVSNDYFNTVCWRTCYNLSFLNKYNVRFDTRFVMSEDVLFNFLMYLYATNYKEVDFVGCYNMPNPNSCISTLKKVMINDLSKISQEIYNLEKELGYTTIMENHYIIHNFLTGIAELFGEYACLKHIKHYSQFYKVDNKKFFKGQNKKVYKILKNHKYNGDKREYFHNNLKKILKEYAINQNKLLLYIKYFLIKLKLIFKK